MDKKFSPAFIVYILIGLILGYFIGREHLKHEFKTATENALSGFSKTLQSSFQDNEINQPAKQSLKSKTIIPEEDNSAQKEKTALEKKLKEKQAYINNIELYDLESKYYKTYSSDKMPGVTFKLKNNGDKTLSKVEVTVYFKNKEGNIISEEDYLPVLISKYSYNDDKPLKPNYIWQQENGKFYQAKSVPEEWDEGNVEAKITNIEFQEKN